MGALPRLKRKDDLRYRKGSTNENINCRFCVQFIKDFKVPVYGGGEARIEPRCTIMGLKTSARYRVRPDYTCDAQKYNGK